jgi:hypothetical protein
MASLAKATTGGTDMKVDIPLDESGLATQVEDGHADREGTPGGGKGGGGPG